MIKKGLVWIKDNGICAAAALFTASSKMAKEVVKGAATCAQNCVPVAKETGVRVAQHFNAAMRDMESMKVKDSEEMQVVVLNGMKKKYAVFALRKAKERTIKLNREWTDELEAIATAYIEKRIGYTNVLDLHECGIIGSEAAIYCYKRRNG